MNDGDESQMKRQCPADGSELSPAAQASVPIMQTRLFPDGTHWIIRQMGGGVTAEPWFCPTCGQVAFFIPSEELATFVESSREKESSS